MVNLLLQHVYYFQSALHVTNPPVWLPYTAIDQLMNILNQYDDDSPLNEVCFCYTRN